ncbi:hypothetical protein FHG87_015143 [Trinorchestia longiramus]|nr:hypothetical protein FHG87_015143 [Trinorchestia longiramus]
MVWINDPLPEDSKLAIPVRRIDEGGTIGRPIKLKSNYFKIEFSKQGITINHFDVKITVAQCIQKEELCEKPKNNETLSASKALEDAPEPSSVKKIEKEKKQVHSNGSSYDANTGTSKASSAIPGSIPAASHSYIPKAVKQRIFEAFIEESSLVRCSLMS